MEESKKLNVGADKNEKVRHNSSVMDNDSVNNRLITVEQLRGLLNLGQTSIYSLVNKNRLKSVKIGSRRLFRPSDICDFINSLSEDEHERYGY